MMFDRVHWVIYDDGTSWLYDDGENTGISLMYYKIGQVEYVKVMEGAMVIYDKEGGNEVSYNFMQNYSSNKIRVICENCSNEKVITDKLLYIETDEKKFGLLFNGYHSGIEIRNFLALTDWRISYRMKEIEMASTFEMAYKRGKMLFAEKYLLGEKNINA
jgi:hypothetical protein